MLPTRRVLIANDSLPKTKRHSEPVWGFVASVEPPASASGPCRAAQFWSLLVSWWQSSSHSMAGWTACACRADKTGAIKTQHASSRPRRGCIRGGWCSMLCSFDSDWKLSGSENEKVLITQQSGRKKFSTIRPHLNHELSLYVGVEYPQALLMIERVEREGLRKVAGMQFSRVCGERLLTAHRIGDEIVRGFVCEALCAPRVLSNGIHELDGTPATKRHRKPLRPEASAQAVNRLIIVSHHHEMIDVLDAVQAS